ncbi:hypothetical protein CG709_18835, partial [Lachnotalea glycerini]
MNRGFILLATILLLAGGKVYAAEADMSITDSSEFNDINKSLDLLLDGDEVDFKEMIVNIIKGKEPLNVETLLQTLVNKAFGQISYVKKTILHIMIIAIAAAILNNFSSVFNNNQIADISFYVVYMLLLTVLMKSFVSVTT